MKKAPRPLLTKATVISHLRTAQLLASDSRSNKEFYITPEHAIATVMVEYKQVYRGYDLDEAIQIYNDIS